MSKSTKFSFPAFWLICWVVSLVLVAFGGLSSCDEPKQETEKKIEVAPKDTIKDTVVQVNAPEAPRPPIFDSTFDRIASYIAGISDTSNSFGKTHQDSVWYRYARAMDKSWELAQEKRYNLLRQWADSESLVSATTGKTLLYPFSGPDFLNAHTLFPNCNEYILAGLEPVGCLPQIEDWKPQTTHGYLSSVSLSLKDILMSSFFHTKKMKVHFKRENINGALPIITVFLKRTGHTITNIEALQINKDSGLKVLPYDTLLYHNFKANGVKITFMDSSSYALRHFYFFSQDLSNSGVYEGSGFKKYLDSLDGYFTFVKSASYLMHYDYFANVRNVILDHAIGIFQDDTGVPYRYLEPEKWEVKLYGRYSKPVKPFLNSRFFQKDLQKVYRKDSLTIEQLPFPLGYHQQINKTNLIIAKRK